MYSKEISEFLKSQKINVGDRIKAEYDGVVLEGELMPKTEASSPDTLIIKLKSGYNVGVAFSNMRISKLEGGSVEPGAFPSARLKQEKGLPKVSLVYTGGTIGNKIDYRTGGVYPLLKPEELFYEVPELSKIAQISMENPFSIASEDLSPADWGTIAGVVAKQINSGARGVIVTMGTDTMHYTAAALSFMLQGINAPVVVTGAQRSSDRGSSDAFMNLICAVHIAANSDIAEVGVCMHRSSADDSCHFIRGTKVRKMHSTRRDAFRPVNDVPIATVSQNGKIDYVSQYKKITKEHVGIAAKTGFESKVALVKAYPGSNPRIIDFYAEKGYRGIIIEGTGMGHLPVSPSNKGNSWIPSVKAAVDSGIIVGMTTQCLYGRVNTTVYSNLRRVSSLGVVYCEDMLPETAYIKLGWLLGNYGAKEAGALLNRNIAGEISQRTDFDAFLV